MSYLRTIAPLDFVNKGMDCSVSGMLQRIRQETVVELFVQPLTATCNTASTPMVCQCE
jgi:hypothetical protein